MEDTPVIFIMGADTLTGLTTARSLKKLPIQIVGLYERSDSITLASNSWDVLFGVPKEILEQFDELVKIKQSHYDSQKAVLLFTGDDQVIAYWKYEEKLDNIFIVPVMNSKEGRFLMDKTLFHEWAVKENVPVPHSLPLNKKEDIKVAKTFSYFPCILKPMVRGKSWNTRYPNNKILKFNSSFELSNFLDLEDIFNFSDSYILQKWIEGGDSDIYFVLYAHDLKGNLLGKLGGRKILQWPPLEGSTAICEIYNDKSLINTADLITEKTKLVGLNSLEFKKDSIDGKFYMTEPTVGRNDYQSGLSMLAAPVLTEKLIHSVVGWNNIKSYSPLPLKEGLWIDEISLIRYLKEKNSWFIFKVIALVFKKKLRLSFLLLSVNDWRPFAKLFFSKRKRL